MTEKTKPLGNSQKAVLGYVKFHPGESAQDIGDALYTTSYYGKQGHCSTSSNRRTWASKILQSLKQKGLVTYSDINNPLWIYCAPTTIPKERWPVHERHCCPKHGCKYGDPDCPVVLKLTDKHNDHCEVCNEPEQIDQIEIIEKWIEHELIPLKKHPLKNNTEMAYDRVLSLCRAVKENPQSVIEKGKAEGWLK